jgi:hypothetical protein
MHSREYCQGLGAWEIGTLAKILIAGEDLAAMLNVEGTVTGEGHEVLTATNGLDAYTMALEE